MPSRSSIALQRLAAQRLTTPGPARAADVVRYLGAVQAQDYPGAKWALSMRARDATDAAIERELSAGAILRTHVLRPTWHFVAPEDIRWMLALTGPRVARTMSYYNPALGLTPVILRRGLRVIERALRDGAHLTRLELRDALVRAGLGAMPGQRLARVVMQAELEALICSGPMRGTQFTYALLDLRARPAPPRERDDALGELTTRYFRSRSPATAADFAWWSGLTVADARRGIAIVGTQLAEVAASGRTAWRWRDAPRLPRRRTAHLLPNYDEFFIGFRDRSAIAQRLGQASLVTGGNALIAHVIVVDGQLVGGWRRATRDGAVVVQATLLDRITPAERRLIAAEVRRFGSHVGTDAVLYASGPDRPSRR